MKKHLLPQSGAYYKAGMHLHTTVSDGCLPPEETKKAYMEKGYSILAFTDHDVFVPHNDLTDESFVAINSFEVGVSETHNGPSNSRKCYHLNLYAMDQNQTTCAVFSPRYAGSERQQQYVTEEARQYDYVRHYSVGKINELIEKANADGFLVCYNHPLWSVQDYEDYAGLKNLWGVEVYNHSCTLCGYYETPQAYYDLLHKNQTIFPVASDDAHRTFEYGGGWLMVHADKLDYRTVMDALARGDFYASSGPEIKEFSIDGTSVHVSCSEAVSIAICTERRTVLHKRGSADAPITEADFDLSKYVSDTKAVSYYPWRPLIRLEIVDKYGKVAYSRPYYLEEFTE